MKKLTNYLSASFLILSTSTAFAQDLRAESSAAQTAATGAYSRQITDLAGASACTKYSWKNRGRAPAGYVKGVALSFARSICRVKSVTPTKLATIFATPDTHNARTDALAHYQSTFAALRISSNVAGESAVRAVYTLGLGLGMRESSGAYCEGWDTSAGSKRSSATGEAGLFQVSYDSMGASPELRKLYQEYQATPGRCQLNVFKEGASCRSQSILGSGAGATYQAFNKACPAFATEYAMTMLRVQRSHFGPINRKEAEVIPVCESLLTKVQQLIDSNPEGACAELY